MYNALPLKIGQILNIPSPPTPRYWPIDNSIKNIGIPAVTSVRIQGMRNAPKKKKI